MPSAALIGAAGGEVFLTSGGTESNALAIFGAVSRPARPPRDLRRGAPVGTGAGRAAGLERAVRARHGGSGALGSARPRASPRGGGARARCSSRSWRPATSTVASSRSRSSRRNCGGAAFSFTSTRCRRRDGWRSAADAFGVDLVSISAHKMHGPKGAGALFVRRGVALEAHTPGGGQEKKLRAGTENTPAIVGFGVAAALAARRQAVDAPAVARLRDRLERGILERIAGNGGRRGGHRAAAEHRGGGLCRSVGRGAADPARPRRRRRVRGKRLLERHARAVARAARARALARGGQERRPLFAVPRDDGRRDRRASSICCRPSSKRCARRRRGRAGRSRAPRGSGRDRRMRPVPCEVPVRRVALRRTRRPRSCAARGAAPSSRS